MNDTISRQAAIDALEREKTYSTAYKDGYTHTDYFKQYNMGLTDGIKALNKLPSANSEVIKCKECRFWTNNIKNENLRNNYCNELEHGYHYHCNGEDFCSKGERKNERFD